MAGEASRSKNGRSGRSRRRTPPDPEPEVDQEVILDRANEIVKNGRALWFTLMGALVFAGVTLASVKDAAFFLPNVDTRLPLLGISVPVTSFFWAGSVLTAAFYIYLHIYLEPLWPLLAKADARKKGIPLAERIHPWIVIEAALRLRDWIRKPAEDQTCVRPRAMGALASAVSYALAWGFGPVVLFGYWWRSMPAHEPLMTGFIGIVLLVTVAVCLSSLSTLAFEMGDGTRHTPIRAFALLTCVWVAWMTVMKTGAFDLTIKGGIASVDLREVIFTEKPKDWQGLEIAEAEFRARWCDRRVAEDGGEKRNCANPLALSNRQFADAAEEKAFQDAWKERRTAMLAAFPKPDLREKDLRGANLESAKLEGTDLYNAKLDGADLSLANLEGANLLGARLKGANLVAARLDNTDLSLANLELADLAYTVLTRADLGGATLNGAGLLLAKIDSAKLNGAALEGANLSLARLFGTAISPLDLQFVNLSGAVFSGSALRHVDLSEVNVSELEGFESAFVDASVELPPGTEHHCHWGDGSGKMLADQIPLSEEAFFGRWRGWLEQSRDFYYLVQSGGLDQYPAIPPPPGCEWPKEEASVPTN
ncbi:MAG: pentapeptide repeat-containing protein [Pseudomonadota bacterium]|nr:pentapeptide repeat-containing protein [Pseudomonadota bacterium]MEC9368840.1 pentapeptide repeat-containing protein [Pseudomonadota bacterium]